MLGHQQHDDLPECVSSGSPETFVCTRSTHNTGSSGLTGGGLAASLPILDAHDHDTVDVTYLIVCMSQRSVCLLTCCPPLSFQFGIIWYNPSLCQRLKMLHEDVFGPETLLKSIAA